VGDLQVFDAAALGGGWCPPLMAVINMYEMPTGLTREGITIRLTMD
jgi:hypothetical protein